MSALSSRTRWARLGHLHSTISENECFSRLGTKITVSDDPIVKCCYGGIKVHSPNVWRVERLGPTRILF